VIRQHNTTDSGARLFCLPFFKRADLETILLCAIYRPRSRRSELQLLIVELLSGSSEGNFHTHNCACLREADSNPIVRTAIVSVEART
jgi:hypothetical protein